MLKDNNIQRLYIPKDYREKIDKLKEWRGAKNRAETICLLADLGMLVKGYIDRGESLYVCKEGKYHRVTLDKK